VKTANINIFFARLIIDHLVRRGVKLFCLSPGSRSALLVAAASEHPDTDVKVIIDERAAGYFAVGYARSTGQPPAVICTSGTAAANFFPSAVEAYQSRLPVIYLTADRPNELQDCGANQSINQKKLFGVYAPSSITLEAPNNNTDPYAVLSAINDALHGQTAPVHINCRFREPLVAATGEYEFERLQSRVEQWYAGNDESSTVGRSPDISQEVALVASKVNKKCHGIIVAGPEAPFRKTEKLFGLADALGWPVAADILSQHRFNTNNNLCGLYDLYLDDERLTKSFRPDMVIHIGGLPTSKRLNRFLHHCKGIDYIKIQNHDRTTDPDHLETERIMADPDEFIKELIPNLQQENNSSNNKDWQDAEAECSYLLQTYFNNGPLSEPAVAWQVGKMIAGGESLYLSNSMPVRDADSFIRPVSKDIPVGANRGASGIDGVIASACGFAAGSRRPTTLLIGDIALIHDLNSLNIAAQSDYPVVIVVINNNGGGIFHFLPVIIFQDTFEDYFGTPHGLSFECAAEMFDLPYYHPATTDRFQFFYSQARNNGKSAVIEITIDRRENFAEHEAIQNHLHQRLKL
jgi:2-succinyl-5-enolpyruvyl-6-hydroxy-3-cyclohexene-1-carboxylate synthase